MADEEEEIPLMEAPEEFSASRGNRALVSLRRADRSQSVTPYQAEQIRLSRQKFEYGKQQDQNKQSLEERAARLQEARAQFEERKMQVDMQREEDALMQAAAAYEEASLLDFSSPSFQPERAKILKKYPRAYGNKAIQDLWAQQNEHLSTYQKNFREDQAMREVEAATEGMVPTSVTGNTITYKQPEQRYGLTDEQNGIAEQLNAKYGLDSSALAQTGVKVSAGRFNPKAAKDQFDYDPNGPEYRVVTSSKPDALGNPVEKAAIIPKAEYEDFKARFNAPRQAAAPPVNPSFASTPPAQPAPAPVDTAAFIRSFITKPKRKDTP